MLTAFIKLYQYRNCEPKTELPKSKFNEYFTGVKKKQRARVYIAVFLTRRIGLALYFLLSKDMNPYPQLTILLIVNCTHLYYLIFIRPYSKFSNNVIEVINEIFLATLICLLIYYNKYERWKASVRLVYLSLFCRHTPHFTKFANPTHSFGSFLLKNPKFPNLFCKFYSGRAILR